MPRVKLFNKEEAIQKAMELFWTKGYVATSLSDLTTHMGIGKGSFYDTFGSKQALFELCFDAYRSTQVRELEHLLNSETDIKKGIKKLLMLTLDNLLDDEHEKGCMVANTCSELKAVDKKFQEKLVAHHSIVQNALMNYLKNKVNNSKQITNMVFTFIMGMNQETKYNKNRRSYTDSIAMILSALN